jgi:hypothetical protein
MARRVVCSFCGTKKWMESKYFRENLLIFKAENEEQLNAKYLCRICRVIKQPNELKRTSEFKKFQRKIQEIFDEYFKRGWNNREAEMFCKTNVEALLAENHIGPKEFKLIRDGYKINGILLMNMPFWHEVLVEIQWKG